MLWRMRTSLYVGVAAGLAAIVASGMALQGQAPALVLVGAHVLPMDRERVIERRPAASRRRPARRSSTSPAST